MAPILQMTKKSGAGRDLGGDLSIQRKFPIPTSRKNVHSGITSTPSITDSPIGTKNKRLLARVPNDPYVLDSRKSPEKKGLPSSIDKTQKDWSSRSKRTLAPISRTNGGRLEKKQASSYGPTDTPKFNAQITTGKTRVSVKERRPSIPMSPTA